MLIIALLLFFNMNNMTGIDTTGTIAILLGASAILSMIITPKFWCKNSVSLVIIFWSETYLITVTVAWIILPRLNDINPYVILKDLGAIGIIVLLTYKFSKNIMGFEEIVNTIIPVDGMQLPTMTDSLREINTRLLQARRSDKPLSLILVDTPSHFPQGVVSCNFKEIEELILKNSLLQKINRVILQTLRRTDLVAKLDENKDKILIMCPDIGLNEADILIKRICDNINQELNTTITIGTASFPNDAVTLYDLIEIADSRLSKVNDINLSIEKLDLKMNTA
jgi:GGDEF domain-containing protein